MTIWIGARLGGRWELTTRLASGGMGDIYRARDHDGGGDVAVKVLRDGVTQGDVRFAGEVEMLRRLQHPHVVAVIDAGKHDDVPFLVMELLPGRSLADLLRGGPLLLEHVRSTGEQIASALGYAHDRGVINRDVKPSNILYTDDGTAKLADFGIAKLLDTTGITSTGMTLGTATYIAPEQLSAQDDVGPPADVYALGLVLLEAASGERAFDGVGTEAALARLARDPVIPDSLPEGWRRLLSAMTARAPSTRPTAETVQELLARDLPDRLVAGLPLPASSIDQDTMELATAAVGDEASPPGEPDQAGRGRWWPATVLLALAALTAVLAFTLQGEDPDGGSDGTLDPNTEEPGGSETDPGPGDSTGDDPGSDEGEGDADPEDHTNGSQRAGTSDETADQPDGDGDGDGADGEPAPDGDDPATEDPDDSTPPDGAGDPGEPADPNPGNGGGGGPGEGNGGGGPPPPGQR